MTRGTQGLTSTSVDFSLVRFCDIHQISQQFLNDMEKLPLHTGSSKMVFLKSLPHLPGANELKSSTWLIFIIVHYTRVVLKIRAICNARDLWKLAQSCKSYIYYACQTHEI